MTIDVNARDNYGYTGFFFACQEGHLNVAKVLMEKSVALGIDLNAKDARNPTAFPKACIKGHTDIVQLVIDFSVDFGGIDLNTHNEFGYCAFRWACAAGHSYLVKILIENAVLLSLDLTDHGTYPQLPTQPRKKLFGFKLIQ